MPNWNDFFTVFLLFWPAVVTVSIVGFLAIAGLIFLISGVALIFCIFLYGAYALLRDSGTLDWALQKLLVWKHDISSHISLHLKQSFLIRDIDSIPKGPALFIGHPHGLYALSWFLHIAFGLTEWPAECAKPVMAVHSIFFRIPILREIFLRYSCIEATEEAILKTLANGTSVVLLVGGIEELQYTDSESIKLILKKRKGYARIAKEAKVPLVPLLTVGENELFPVTESWVWKIAQDWLYNTFHIALPLPTWRSLLSWGSLMHAPFAKPIETFVLPPLTDVSRMSIKDIRDAYVQNLRKFAELKQIHLEIVK